MFGFLVGTLQRFKEDTRQKTLGVSEASFWKFVNTSTVCSKKGTSERKYLQKSEYFFSMEVGTRNFEGLMRIC